MPLRRAAPSHCQRSAALAVTHCTELAVTAARTATRSVRELTFQVSSCQLWQLLAAAFWRVACDYNLGKPQHRATLLYTERNRPRARAQRAGRAALEFAEEYKRRHPDREEQSAQRSRARRARGRRPAGRRARGRAKKAVNIIDHRAATVSDVHHDQIRCRTLWQRQLAGCGSSPGSPGE